MGKSFFNGTETELRDGSANFAAKILATPVVYGLTSTQATAYGVVNTAFQNAMAAILDPATRTKAKVAAKNTAKTAVRTAASNLAKIIEGTPTVTDEQKIDLGLSVRATPAPMPPPGTPNRFKVALSTTGAVDLAWKCNNPTGSTGTIYQVWRRIGAEGEFEYLGGSGTKAFSDSTVPAGSSQVTYQIQAVRSTAIGEWAQYNVNFGMGGSGAMITSAEETAPVKKAA